MSMDGGDAAVVHATAPNAHPSIMSAGRARWLPPHARASRAALVCLPVYTEAQDHGRTKSISCLKAGTC